MENDPRRGGSVAIVVVIVLVLAGWWLTRPLHDEDSIQDCVMSGRTNCAPVRPNQ